MLEAWKQKLKIPWQIVCDIVYQWYISEILPKCKCLRIESYFVPKLFWIRVRGTYCGNMTQRRVCRYQFLAMFLRKRKFLGDLFL